MGATIAATPRSMRVFRLFCSIRPGEPNEAELAAGLTLADSSVRNRITGSRTDGLMKMKPAPFFLPGYAANIEIGNFDDDMPKLRSATG